MFQEIVTWRHLSHPNVLPVLGISPKLFPLCVVTEWMTNGNITEFTSKHPEVNRLRLVCPISPLSPGPQILKYIQSSQKRQVVCSTCTQWISFMATSTPYALPNIPLSHADPFTKGNILINRNGHPCLVGYGLPFHTGVGLNTGIHTKKDDIFAFGSVAYWVGTHF